MKKLILSFVLIIISALSTNLYAQSPEESCQIIESEIKDGIYTKFSVNSNGILTYVWTDKKSDSETILTIDLTKITVSKDVSSRGYRVFINCIDGIDCVNERGKLGTDETYYSDFSKTYLPANDEKGMVTIYNQMVFLLKLGNTNR
ncbi:MAG: hypothetical protein PHG98_00175 [Bacteroidales bacterium]|jgi:hypothetical protein|uniref:Uncharacterized protein n=1 Tax=bioreactor metagenome TaxID=1076179 RepID=A0A644TIK4_9ZZZZ|nr:hypothetical protein [Bacteroidales bacterium]MDD4738350.1 hypothetical protein [Bacteroidales bacterium]MEA4967776.1 hypothetical protein [Bacteroidaceae bacterium]MEA5100786.1 hypothetical protein [Bacteroidales bacterium]NCC17741.1 hypothetical protein [Bacteroidia bacterium]